MQSSKKKEFLVSEFKMSDQQPTIVTPTLTSTATTQTSTDLPDIGPNTASTGTSTSNLNLLAADNVSTSTASIQTGTTGSACANCLDDGTQNVVPRKISQSTGSKPFPVRCK